MAAASSLIMISSSLSDIDEDRLCDEDKYSS